jgi:capsular exopolysaccharide synthesis family protein
MIFAFFTVVMIIVLITLRQERIYSAACTVIIDLTAPKVLEGQVQEVVDSGTGGYWYTRDYYETQYKVISSRTVASRVVERLHLGENLKFLGLDKVQDGAAREKLRSQADATARVQSMLHVDPIKESRMVQLRVENPDPQLAAAIANAFAEAYIAETVSIKMSTTQTASDWLETQLMDLENKLEKSTQGLYAFKKEKDIVSTSFEDKQSMVSQRLVALNDALTKVRVQRAQLQARSGTLNALVSNPEYVGASGNASTPGTNSFVIEQMKLRVLDLGNECADLKHKYLALHPKLASCQERLELAKASLKREVNGALSAWEREFREVIQTEKNLASLYNDSKTEAFKVNQNEEEYQRLKRAMDNNQRLYDMVLKRLKDTGLSGLMRMSNVHILDQARPAGYPVRPNLPVNFLFAVALGILASCLLGFVVEYLDSTINSQEQVEQFLKLTFLGVLPRIRVKNSDQNSELIVYNQPKSAVAECCRSIRTNLLFMSPEKPLKSILVTSGGVQDGKTTSAVSLAAIMADSGNRVLLLDADMRRPRAHRVFNVPNEVGLSSVIVGTAKIEDAIKSTEVPGLSVMVCGPLPPNPTELLSTRAFANLLRSLEEKYDRIIIDSPPVVVVSDAAIISTLVDGTVVVIKAGRTSRDLGQRALRALKNVNARIFGAVLNDLDIEDRHNGYYYSHYSQYYGPAKDEAAS